MIESGTGRDGGDTNTEMRETRLKPRKLISKNRQCLTPTGKHIGDCHSSLTFSVLLVSINKQKYYDNYLRIY